MDPVVRRDVTRGRFLDRHARRSRDTGKIRSIVAGRDLYETTAFVDRRQNGLPDPPAEGGETGLARGRRGPCPEADQQRREGRDDLGLPRERTSLELLDELSRPPERRLVRPLGEAEDERVRTVGGRFHAERIHHRPALTNDLSRAGPAGPGGR